jgi:hypothetical protein
VAISASEYNRRIRAAQRQAEQEINRRLRAAQQQAERESKGRVDAYNREVEAHNRKVDAQNRKAINDHNRAVAQHNRRADAHNQRVIDEINRRLATASRPQVEIRYTPDEQALVDRVHDAVPIDDREYDLFCSYARIDGSAVAKELHAELEALRLSVWLDEVAIRPGKSMALQMDQGLRKARAGVVVLTPAYLTGRFWTERELGALLHKDILIPVLHAVTFDDVKEYSGILPDLVGFTTESDTVAEIAAKIASAVLVPVS